MAYGHFSPRTDLKTPPLRLRLKLNSPVLFPLASRSALFFPIAGKLSPRSFYSGPINRGFFAVPPPRKSGFLSRFVSPPPFNTLRCCGGVHSPGRLGRVVDYFPLEVTTPAFRFMQPVQGAPFFLLYSVPLFELDSFAPSWVFGSSAARDILYSRVLCFCLSIVSVSFSAP